MGEKNRLTVGQKIVGRLKNFVEAIEGQEAIPERFTRRTIRLNLETQHYTPERVKETRKALGASQAVFAQFLGVSTRAVQDWEQGQSEPHGAACRMMDEIRANPEYFVQRLKTLAEACATE